MEDRAWSELAAASLGYRFRDESLLRQALTHRSYANEAGQTESFQGERLEFLGDAVLQLLISEWLLGNEPQFDEGQLTRMRAILVNEKTLARAGRALGLGELMLLGKGEEASGGREKDSLLADAFEAVCAAIYRDGGLPAARDFLGRALRPEFTQLDRSQLHFDPKSRLQQLLQKRGEGLPSYRMTGHEGPDHRRVFSVEVSCAGGKVLAEGRGSSKKEAEQAAARAALEILDAAGQR